MTTNIIMSRSISIRIKITNTFPFESTFSLDDFLICGNHNKNTIIFLWLYIILRKKKSTWECNIFCDIKEIISIVSKLQFRVACTPTYSILANTFCNSCKEISFPINKHNFSGVYFWKPQRGYDEKFT